MQLDEQERGFSFSKEGPLDMRMDPSDRLTAEQIVNRWPENKLGELFRDYGEEARWRKAAKVIVERRKKKPIKTTKELADLIADSLGRGGKKKLHPATLIFQALRISVNEELKSIETGIEKAIDYLAPGGRLGVISFHRLEDRIVKNLFRKAAEKCRHEINILTKKPLVPKMEETKINPRSRSAKMRFLERVK